MPDEEDLWKWVAGFNSEHVVACVELVSGYAGSGVTASGKHTTTGSSMFKFGENFGMIKGMLIAAGISYRLVAPQKWQHFFPVRPKAKSEKKTAWKNRLKAYAQELYPDVPVTLAAADALLLATYCKATYR
jgi:hypothetical protein